MQTSFFHRPATHTHTHTHTHSYAHMQSLSLTCSLLLFIHYCLVSSWLLFLQETCAFVKRFFLSFFFKYKYKRALLQNNLIICVKLMIMAKQLTDNSISIQGSHLSPSSSLSSSLVFFNESQIMRIKCLHPSVSI